jgi:membrane protease YdiL (CAAX protease family)
MNAMKERLDSRAVTAAVLTTLLILVDYYHPWRPGWATTAAEIRRTLALENVGLYLLVPLVVILFVFRERPSDYGFSLGDWREGLKWTAISLAIFGPITWLAGRQPALTAFYEGRLEVGLGNLALTSAIDLLGWEFIFRGFLLFALARVAGPNAIILQAIPFAIAHQGKPELETLSTIFGGSAFGWVAWRSRSFLYPFLIHLGVNVLVVLAAVSG